MNVLTIQDLSKRYGSLQALDQVSFTLESGQIYGLVGNNGAGKTTLLRILAGLVAQDHGTVTLFGKSSPKGLRAARRNAGFLLPRESFSPDMTALQNLLTFQRLQGYRDPQEAENLLAQAGLDEIHRRKWKLKGLSTGEFQRAAIAAAQLGAPKLLVLDEPQNGLDPSAVHQFREQMEALRQQGTTILLSSHMLSELYLLATDFIFLHRGKILRTTSREALSEQLDYTIRLQVSSPARACETLRQLQPQVDRDGTLVLSRCPCTITEIRQQLRQADIQIHQESVSGRSLEDYFLALTGGEGT